MIGVLDSGIGGLSVWRELMKVLPEEEYLYVADSGYCPYGPREKSYIRERVSKISAYLIDNNAEIIVVACNTATAAAIDYLRSNYSLPFVGMEPAVKPAALESKSGVIGVLATMGTFRGELYLSTLHKFASNVKVIEQIGSGLVELVECGKTETPEAVALLKEYLDPMIKEGADCLVLGCTHYPFLINAIRKVAGDKMKIINPAPAIAMRTKDILAKRRGCERTNAPTGCTKIVTTGGNIGLIEDLLRRIAEEDGLSLNRFECMDIVI